MSQPVQTVDNEKTVAVPATPQEHDKEMDLRDGAGPKWLPQGMRESLGRIGNKVTHMRTATIMATPAPIVNNSSNILGASHVATEFLFFKSGMKDNKLVDHPEKLVNWVKEPVQKILADIVTRSQARDYSLPQLFRGNIAKNVHTYVMDTHAASHRELDRQIAANRELMAVGKAVKPLSLGNPWQTRTTGTGIVIWLLSAVLPERKESDDEIERMAKMRTLHPIQYISTRLKQAVWVPEWTTHKREMLGLGYLTIGIFSGLGSWRNRGELKAEIAKDAELIQKGLKQGYRFNAGYFATSVVSFICGLPLLFALDERKAYSTYGSLSILRIPALPSSLYSKVKDKESGWQYYVFGKLIFQVEDFMFSLIGGATKKVHPDGTVEIIDHEKLKKKAIHEAKVEKRQSHGEVNNERRAEHVVAAGVAPSTVIAHADMPERAMPERVEQVAKEKEAATPV